MHTQFQSVNEEVEEIQGKVKGNIPPYVRGSLFRNGPAKYQIGEYKMQHLFDGMAAVQKWSIDGNNVTYQRKFVKSETFKKNMEANRIVVGEFGTREVPDPCKNIFQRFFSAFTAKTGKVTDNTSVTVWPQMDRVFVSTETETIHEIDPVTLDTIGSVHLSDLLTINSSTAHTHWTEDGTVYSIGLFYKGKPKHCVVEIPGKKDKEDSFKNIRIAGETQCRWRFHPGYIHSFNLTENYFVYPEQTFAWSIPMLASMPFHNKSAMDNFQWYPDEKTLFKIIDRKSGVPLSIKYTSEAQFTFHHINAYEEDGHLVLDMSAYKDAEIIKNLYLENYTEEKISQTMEKEKLFGEVRRFVFPLNVDDKTPENENLVRLTGCKATAKKISEDEVYCEYEVLYSGGTYMYDRNNAFPMFYRSWNTYVYGVGLVCLRLVKLNVSDKTYKLWEPTEGIVSEPVFVPNPEQKSEDDGVVLSPVKAYGKGARPYLILLDGKTFTELARIEFDTSRFSLDFHGFFRAAET
uniref:Beta,beta-carotene-15,15'-dioxygenase n=1 Tax=Pinctada imbricata TaxID=66713 RepID=A0A346M701_PINIB|nr:beta,beta-carotene-15,15'-dioxygenase [Pinctada imbricata]